MNPVYEQGNRAYELRPKMIERFWRKVEKGEGCWLWRGAAYTRGYGYFHVGGNRGALAHRIAYLIANGHLDKDLCVCHSCDVPLCVNPAHLWQGTRKANFEDSCRKGRSLMSPGEKNHTAKLTTRRAQDIRQRYEAGGVTQAELGNEFGISRQQIHNIISGKNWQSLPLESEAQS